MRNPRTLIRVVVVSSALCLAAASAAAGRSSAQNNDPKSILDRIYSVAQAERGEQRFKVSCSSCHVAESFADGMFAARWEGQTMGDVFEYVSTAMPENDPGGLTSEDYAEVLAFILALNAYPVGNDDMPGDREALRPFAIVPNPK